MWISRSRIFCLPVMIYDKFKVIISHNATSYISLFYISQIWLFHIISTSHFTMWVYILQLRLWNLAVNLFYRHNFNFISYKVTFNFAVILQLQLFCKMYNFIFHNVTIYIAIMTFSHIFNFILHKVALHFAITTLILQLYVLQCDCITFIFVKAFFL